MSGGSHNYIAYQIEQELGGMMEDKEMNELIQDIIEVAHDLEWWKSGDIDEHNYRKTVDEFKTKWFRGDGRTSQGLYIKRLKRYVEEELQTLADKVEMM